MPHIAKLFRLPSFDLRWSVAFPMKSPSGGTSSSNFFASLDNFAIWADIRNAP